MKGQPLSHVDEQGKARMVDVSDKSITRRVARASGFVSMKEETATALEERRTPKGDPIETARIAGIVAAKRTAELVPLCHPLLIEHVDVRAALEKSGVRLTSEVVTTGKTGAEMEALTAVTVAALTIYDMCKAMDRSMTIEAVRLEHKSGGKSGAFDRSDPAVQDE
ncbi:MAG: cyclic pyranopterin monophosphate synthase MoaC [Myxococcota bacterium]|jgi:cyclic pyranopterin phosphate synthase|nr:cyclic pyranopterin monophosphate synthase MoaC [Myxococcota bacterium]